MVYEASISFISPRNRRSFAGIASFRGIMPAKRAPAHDNAIRVPASMRSSS